MFRIGEFRFLWPLVRRELPSYAFGAVLIAATSAFLVAVPRLVGAAIECLATGSRIDLVGPLALALVGVALLRGLTAFYMRRVVIGASRRIEFQLKNQMFEHLQTLDSPFFVQSHTGDLMSRFTSDMDAVRAVLGPGVMYTINTFFTLSLALGVMFWVSAPLTFYSLLPLALLTTVIRTLGPRVHRESMRAQERLSDLSVVAQENFSNVKVVKAFVREDAEIERMRDHSDAYFKQNPRLAHLRSLTNGLIWLVGDLVIIALIALGGYELIEGRIGLGEFATFKGCQLLLIWPMVALGWVMTIFQRGAASAERLRSVLGAKPVVDDRRAAADAHVTAGGIEAHEVEFAYVEGERPTLSGIDFRLAPGQTLGVVGPTGSGKSTLLALLPRLHEVSAGRLEIDGQPIERIPLAELRDHVGFVSQEPFLFSATVEENITFGVDRATAEEITEVARLVCIHDEILSFPYGYAQRVGERGITLSGGQKQRIALARALLKRPRILVLDDVLSAMDAETEAKILAGLRTWTADLTTVIATHRLSAVRHADDILVLVDGRVVERGTHPELVAASGLYAGLHRKQILEDELRGL